MPSASSPLLSSSERPNRPQGAEEEYLVSGITVRHDFFPFFIERLIFAPVYKTLMAVRGLID